MTHVCWAYSQTYTGVHWLHVYMCRVCVSITWCFVTLYQPDSILHEMWVNMIRYIICVIFLTDHPWPTLLIQHLVVSDIWQWSPLSHTTYTTSCSVIFLTDHPCPTLLTEHLVVSYISYRSSLTHTTYPTSYSAWYFSQITHVPHYLPNIL